MRTQDFHLPVQWTLQETDESAALFTNAVGDSLSISYIHKIPDIAADVSDAQALRSFYRTACESMGVAMLEVDATQVAGLLAVRTLLKAPLQPTGFAFIGSYTFPFADHSYVLKLQSLERGLTGVRESAVLAMQEKPIEVEEQTGKLVGWEQDPYDPSYRGRFMRNHADDARYDSSFPDHPLSKVRGYLRELAEQLEIASTIRAAKPFKYVAPVNPPDSATPEVARLRVVEGATTSLRSRFDAGARLTLAEALDLMHGLLYALDEIHTGLIIHRNLHPGCVLVDEAGGVTLTGFELAVGPGLPPRGDSGKMSGAWVTMSPEQIQGTGCDARSDLFQAGVIFYQMLTGEPPFAGSGAWSKAEKILREDPAPPSSVNPAIPVSLDGVLARALAKDPGQRYERAAEFAGALVRAVPELHTVLRASNSPLAKLRRLANKLARAWERASHFWR